MKRAAVIRSRIEPGWLAACRYKDCDWSLRADRIRCLDAAAAHVKIWHTSNLVKEKS